MSAQAQTLKNPFKDKKLSKLLFKYSAPAVAGMFVNALFNIISRIYVGQDVGAVGIAAITVIFPIGLLYMGFSALIGIGSNSLFSIRLGEKRHDEALRVMGNGFILLIIMAGFVTSISYLFLDKLLLFCGADEVILPYSREYALWAFPGYFVFAIGAGMNHFIRSSGRPKTAMATQFIGAFINLIAAPLFIFKMGLGIKGAALATVCGQVISFSWVMYCLTGHRSVYRLMWRNFKLKLQIVLDVVAIGFSQFAFQMATGILNVILNHALLKYGGNLAISAMGVALSVNTIIIMPTMGLSQGAQPLIGYNHGARKYTTSIQTLKMAMRWGILVTTVGFIILEVFARPIAAIFNGQDAALIDMASRVIRIVNIFLPIVPLQMMATTFFQAINQPLKAALLSLSRQILLVIPLVLILPLFWELDGVFFAPVVADGVSTLLAVVLLKHFFNQHGQTVFFKKK
ncbi:MAG: MATE family efflux transporter [Elusimicrobiaceae bacterium]|nr:MATE family efflux transporter [Elusimicrobiaceae bacterium]MBP5616927.1 MATE family efflux transporter [Elusimicrobiaceae bacterium]